MLHLAPKRCSWSIGKTELVTLSEYRGLPVCNPNTLFKKRFTVPTAGCHLDAAIFVLLLKRAPIYIINIQPEYWPQDCLKLGQKWEQLEVQTWQN